MSRDLYFDIVSDDWAGGLSRLKTEAGDNIFNYHHTSSDLDTDKTIVTSTNYNNFKEFWKVLTTNTRWFTFHPLYIHPEQRAFIREELKKVNWKIIPDEKWREMYQRQWNKVLNNPAEYYKPMR